MIRILGCLNLIVSIITIAGTSKRVTIFLPPSFFLSFYSMTENGHVEINTVTGTGFRNLRIAGNAKHKKKNTTVEDNKTKMQVRIRTKFYNINTVNI